jgi:REP element-mobilizing transposase RayT
MPDHMHLLIWPQDDGKLGDILRDYKKFTATRIIRQAEVEGNRHLLDWFAAAGSATGRCDRKLWQDDYWDTVVFSQRFLRQKLRYMHRNPVSVGLVGEPGAYPYSSYRNYVCGDESMIEIDRDWMG